MKKRILITGVSGFIGQALWRYFKKQDCEVFGLDIKAQRTRQQIYPCNLINHRQVTSFLTKIHPHYIFHCAGGRIVQKQSLKDANVVTTKVLCETISRIPHFHPRILIPGTAAEYGRMPQGRRLFKEDFEPHPESLYGIVKLKQTNVGLQYARRGLDVIVARMFNIMGDGLPPALSIGRFAEQIVRIEKGRQEKIIRTLNLDGRRDFLDINDVCRALFLLVRHGRAGEIYNVCSGRALTMKGLLSKLVSYAKVRNIVVREEHKEGMKSFDAIGSNAKMRTATSWKPRVNIEKSLRNTLKCYRTLH